MDLTVRDATVDDAPLIAAINLASWEAAYRGLGADAWLDRQTLETRLAWWQERLTGPKPPVFVAESSSDGELIGYCTLAAARDEDCGEEVAEIPALYVSPSVFRTGAGSALMARALEVARSDGHREVVLWVLQANTRARQFYAAQGFTEDGTVKWLEDFQADEIRLRRPF